MKVAVRFRGREINHSAIGTELLQRFADAASEYGSVDKNAKLEGRSMVMFMAPKA